MRDGPVVKMINTETIVTEAAKSAPPVAISVASFVGGISLNNIIGVATLFYIILQAAHLIWKWRRDIKRERGDNETYS